MIDNKLYEIYTKTTYDELIACFNKSNTVEEKNFWSSLVQLKTNEFKLKSMYATSELNTNKVPEEVLKNYDKKYKICKVDEHFFLMTNDDWHRVLAAYDDKKQLKNNIDRLIKDYEDKIRR